MGVSSLPWRVLVMVVLMSPTPLNALLVTTLRPRSSILPHSASTCSVETLPSTWINFKMSPKSTRDSSASTNLPVLEADLEALYKSVHSAIRASPAAQKKTPSVPEGTKPKSYKKTPLSYAQRKDRVRQKIASAQKAKAQA